MEQRQNELGTAPVGYLLRKLAVPAIAAQLVNVLYNIVDRMYIGNIPEIGKLAMTGLGVAMPIIMIMSAFASLVGMGGAPLAAIRLGAKDQEGAEKIIGNCATMLSIVGALLMVVIFCFKRPILLAFGASADTIGYAETYLTVYTIGTLFVMGTLGLNAFITTQGQAGIAMKTVLIGAICNIVLDPVFIFVFHMDVAGAAWATILSQAISFAWVLRFLFSERNAIPIRKPFLRIEARRAGQILALGLSPFIMQATESLVQITLNVGLRQYGGDLAVGSMTIMMSAMQLFMMPIMGLGQGAQPILSYNYGAKQYDRMKQAFKLFFIACLSFAVLVWAVMMLLPQWFVMIFNRDPELMALTTWGMRIFFLGIFAMGAQNAIQQLLLSIGRAKTSIFIATMRKVILLIPLAMILPRFFGLQGIYMAEPISDLTSATIACCIFLVQAKGIFGKMQAGDADGAENPPKLPQS